MDVEKFEQNFGVVERWAAGQIQWYELIMSLAGCLVILCGLIIFGLMMIFRFKSEAVELRVVDIHAEARKIKDDDDLQRIARKQANPMLRPEFEILTQGFSGLRLKSSSSSNRCTHNIGDMTRGYLFVQRQEVMSAEQLRGGLKFSVIFSLVGVFLIVLAQFMTGAW